MNKYVDTETEVGTPKRRIVRNVNGNMIYVTGCLKFKL